MTPVRTDRDVLDLAIQMGLVPGERAADLRHRLDGGGTLAENVLKDAGLSPEDCSHLSYVAARIQTVLERKSDNSDLESRDLTPPPPGPRGGALDPGAAPKNFGRYRIDSMHAAGGMGRVWSAFDELLQRTVALKDVRPDVLQPEVRRRFLEEAKITARLEHPGIIPVYDMPAAGEGPCYVMRFVHGRTFAKAMGEYHHKRRQSRGDSVEFFKLVQAFHSICQTVAYAHAQSVLHRDLKPANVLLGAFGEVLVLDWGLAKGESSPSPRADSDATIDRSVVETQAGQIMGTPAYMSPEQSRGESKSLTPRTDVWSLGVILYELLAGQVPFRGSGLHDTLQLVREASPQSPRSVNPRTPRGLEAVALKAISKNPSDRYASAQELADDISRWLADEPVKACPEPWWQRLARWGRRHTAIVAGAAALVVTAVVALSISTYFISQQRVRAEKNLQTALDVVETYLVAVSESRLLDEPGMQPLRAELLGQAVAYAEKFLNENHADPTRKVDLANKTLLLGRVLSKLNEPQKSVDTLLRARAMFAAVNKANPSDLAAQRGEAMANLSLGKSTLSSDPKLAVQALTDAVDQYQRLRANDPGLDEATEKLAQAFNILGQLKQKQNQLDAAKESHEKAIATIAELVTKTPANVLYSDSLAGFHSNLAVDLLLMKKLPDARKHFETSGSIWQELIRNGAKGLDFEDSLAVSKNHLGYLALNEKRYADADAVFREAIKLRENLVRRNPDVQRYKMTLALGYYSLAKLMVQQNQYAKGIVELDRGISTLEQLAADSPGDIEARTELARLYLYRAYYLFDMRRFDDTDKALEKSLDQLVKFGDSRPPATTDLLADAYWMRAMLRVQQTRFVEAVADYDLAIAFATGSRRDQLVKEREKAAARAK